MANTFLFALPLLLLLPGCDRFFSLAGVVTRCDDGAAIAGVRVRAILVDGASDEEEAEARTDAAGRFSVFLNEPDSATVRIVVDEPGFASRDELYRGVPEHIVEICLEPVR
jgi:hypothetical protein